MTDWTTDGRAWSAWFGEHADLIDRYNRGEIPVCVHLLAADADPRVLGVQVALWRPSQALCDACSPRNADLPRDVCDRCGAAGEARVMVTTFEDRFVVRTALCRPCGLLEGFDWLEGRSV